jgi:hypothetical protein
VQIGPVGMAFEGGGDIAALRIDLEALLARIMHQRLNQFGSHAAPPISEGTSVCSAARAPRIPQVARSVQVKRPIALLPATAA